MFFRQRTVFISHSSANSEIAHQLSGLLKKIGIPSEGIFCSSVLGQGVNNGEKLNDKIFHSISKSDIIIFLISDAFINSSYCMEELGIGWYFAFNYSKICFYIRIPDIEMNELSGFVNAKIDKFSLVNSIEDITLFIENICDSMRIKTPKASDVASDVNTFIGAISESCRKYTTKKSEAKSGNPSNCQSLELNAQSARNQPDNERQRMKWELLNIEELFGNLGLTSVIRREVIIENRDFFFDMIEKYEKLHLLLKKEPSNKGMEKLLAQAYLAYQDYDMAFKHFLNSLKMWDSVYLFDVYFFAECYPHSLKEAILIVNDKLKNSRVQNRDSIKETLKHLEDEESKKQGNG